MVNAAPLAGTGLPDWTSKEEKRGIDPLGMQTTSVALYQELLPGISNVTLRVRYYGLYAWLAQTYAKQVGETSVDVWCHYLRRAEALYALIAAYNGSGRGVAGVLWAGHKLAKTTDSELVFEPNTDRGAEPQYLKQKFGAFGAAYGSQLVEAGVLEYVDDHQVPVPTQEVGDKLAQAFQAEIGAVADVFLAAARDGRVTRSALEQMASMLPTRIGETSSERQLYQDLLFAKFHPEWKAAIARRQSLCLILRVAQAHASDVNANDVRWTLYSERNAYGETIGQLPKEEGEQRFAWGVYQANDLLHVAYEALLKLTLDVLSVPPTGMPLEQLIAKVSARLVQALEGWNISTWGELMGEVQPAENPWSADNRLSEFRLCNAVFEGSSSVSIGNDDFAASAITLLAVLHKRWENKIKRIESECRVVAPGHFVQSIVTEITFLREHKDLPLVELLARLVKDRIVERHLWVAIQKFRGQGDYTYLIESDEGRVRVRQKDGPVLTNPRLSPAIAFLRDIHLLGDDGPTPAGLRVLEVA